MNDLHRDPAVERYLERVRMSLRGMRRREVDEILRELRGHIAERATSAHDVGAVLDALGDPADLGEEYRGEEVLDHGVCSHAPLSILHGLMLLGRRSWSSRGALVLATLGYVLAIVLGAASVEKLFSPHEVGLWQPAGAALPRVMVDGAAPPGSRELLGLWFVPVAAAAFGILLLLTNHFGRWWIRRRRGERGSWLHPAA